MNISEKQIEKLIYENPWILDERFIVPNIPGSQGDNGRQVNIGKKRSRFIDLLFKDTRDNRPVIIEIKKVYLKRIDIAQIIEYRSLLASCDDDTRELWKAEFDQNYFAPKMILVGRMADSDTILSANLAGVEVRTFGSVYENEIGFETFKELKTKLKEWNDFRSTGNRTLIERTDWVQSIVDKINRILENDFDDLSTINKPYTLKGNKCYIEYTFPFLNIPIFFNDEILVGIYEYFDEEFPFDNQFFYCDYSFLYDKEDQEELDEKNILHIKKIMIKAGYDFATMTDSEIPTLKIPRKILEEENELKKTIKSLINNALGIYNKL